MEELSPILDLQTSPGIYCHLWLSTEFFIISFFFKPSCVHYLEFECVDHPAMLFLLSEVAAEFVIAQGKH